MIAPAAIPSPSSNGFSLGPFFFHAYGIAYVFAVARGDLISRRRWGRVGGDPELCYEIAMWAFPAGLIGGRIYFLITTPSQIPDHWWGPFAIWKGGLGIWGGIAAGVAVGLWVAHRRLGRADLLRFMDAAAPGLLVAQAIGRIGNYFNQELFGAPSSLPWALKISPAHRPPGYPHVRHVPAHLPLRDHLEPARWPSFLVWLGSRAGSAPPGLFALYVAGYSGFRIFEETQRIDYSNHIFGLRLNFFVASCCASSGCCGSWRSSADGGAGAWSRPRCAESARAAGPTRGLGFPRAAAAGRRGFGAPRGSSCAAVARRRPRRRHRRRGRLGASRRH